MCPEPAWGDAHTAPALTRDIFGEGFSHSISDHTEPAGTSPFRASLGSFIRSRGECSKGQGDFLLLAAG